MERGIKRKEPEDLPSRGWDDGRIGLGMNQNPTTEECRVWKIFCYTGKDACDTKFKKRVKNGKRKHNPPEADCNYRALTLDERT